MSTEAVNRCNRWRRERPRLSAAILVSVTVSHGNDRGFFPRTHTYFETRRETTDFRWQFLQCIKAGRFGHFRTLTRSARVPCCRSKVMYVAAIRLYDLGHKDEAVYWFYTAQYRARVFTSILDKENVGTIGSEAFELKQAYASFNQLAGEYINGYAFGELPKLKKTLLKVVDEGKSLPKFGVVYPKVKFVDEEKWLKVA